MLSEDDEMALSDQLPVPALRVNCKGWQIERLNSSAVAMLKIVSADLMKEHLSPKTAKLPGWLEGELTKFASLSGLEYSFEKEFIHMHPVRWLKVMVKKLSRQPGNDLGMLVVLLDITPEMSLAKLLRQTRQDLEAQVGERTDELGRANMSLRSYIDECKRSAAALKKLSSAVEQTADHVIITDKSGMIEYVNPAFEKLTGLTNQETVGKTPRIVKSGQHPPEFFQSLWSTILDGQVFRAEFTNRKKNGELYVEEKTITPIKDDHGRITHFVSVGRGR